MSSAKWIEFARRYALWLVLLFTIVASWYVSQEDVSNDTAPETVNLPTPKTSAKVNITPLHDGIAPFEWKLKSVSSRPILDLFGSASESLKETGSENKNINKQSVAPTDPSLTFNFNYAGQVEKNGLQSVVLIDDNQKVLVIPVGGVVNSDWQLVQLDDNIMTVKHTGTGQTYQLKTRLTE